MKKFFLIPLLTLMCSVMAWGAVVNVAQVGDVVYQSNTALSANNPPIYKSDAAAFTAAITAANSADGQTVVLLKTIEKAGSESSDEKTISANMTIDGQGQYSIPRSFTVNEGKTLTLKDVTVNDGFKSNPAGAIVLNNGATLVMNNATIAPTISGVLPVRTVQGASATIQLALGSTNVIRNNGGTALYTYNQAAGDNSSVLTITGDGALNVYHTGTGGYALSANANGGNFLVSAPNVTFIPSDPTKFIGPNAKLADGYLALYENGAYKVLSTSDSRIAAVADGIAYPSIAAAVEAVPFSEIMLWADAPATTIARSVIIKSNGHNASAISAGAGYARVAIEGGYVFGKAASKSGNVYTVNNFDELWFTINHTAVDGDEIKLANDIAYPKNGDINLLLNIQCSLILDGQGYKITGWGKCNSNHDTGKTNNVITPLAINYGEEASNLDVTVKNITMSTVANKATVHEIGLMVFDGVSKLTIESCDIRSHIVSGSNNNSGIAVYGETSDALVLKIKDSFINAGNSGYGMAVLKPINADFQNTTFVGYSCMTLYAPSALMEKDYRTQTAFGNQTSGARGTTINATNCQFDAPNKWSGESNAYATFALEDDGINITLNNCGIDATNYGDQKQWGIMASPRTPTSRRAQNVNVTFNGDNTHINGNLLGIMWAEFQAMRKDYKEAAYGTSPTWFYTYEDGYDYYKHIVIPAESYSVTGNFNMTITGGTYDFDPSAYTYNGHIDTEAAGYAAYLADREAASMEPPFVQHHITIPATHEVKTITMDGVAMSLYRVVPRTTTLYDLNDNVQSQGDGQNPTTSFELSDGSAMTLDQEITKAGYVEVKDNGTDATTITVAKNETNTEESQKLVINNGLDVQGESQVIVEPTAALIIGEGGIVTSKPENIILKADEDGAATLLLDPAITVNQNPNLTVTLKAQSKQLSASPWTYVFHRFAIPVKVGVKPTTDHAGKALFPGETSFESYVFQWNGYNWVTNPSWTALKPFVGYQLANNSAEGGITYTFTGELVGNDNSTYEFPTGGFDFFGNSHLAPIYIDSLLKPYLSSDVEATVWLYDYDSKNFLPITAEDLAEGFSDLPTEIKPMEGFILNLHAASGSAIMDYASAIWGNPKFDAVLGRPSQKGAPARKSAGVAASNRAMVVVSAMNGMSDNVKLIEKESYSADFENGADASKFKFEEAINLYAETEAGELSRVATNDMKGTLLSFQSGDDTSYTLSLSNVLGEDYMLRDNVTGALVAFEEGATYTFMQDANTTVPARFEVVSAAKITTAIDSVEAEANASGIYSITGQFLGRDFTKLPAGVYVVNGVKIVK